MSSEQVDYERLEKDPIYFAQHYLKKYFYLPFASFQHDMVGELITANEQINIVFMPRGFGKTTIVSCLLSLWYAIFKGVHYIVLISQSMARAQQMLDDIKSVLELPEFVEEFGEIADKPWGARRAHIYSEELGIDCYFDVVSIGAQVRGLKVGSTRPELVLLDDMEDDEDVENASIVTKTERWVVKKLKPAMREDESIGVRGKIFWLATTIATDSAVQRVSQYEDGNVKVLKYPALVDTAEMSMKLGIPVGRSIWEEKMSTESLKALRDDLIHKGMSTVWYNEYMNEPRSSEEIVFHEHNNRFFEPSEVDGLEIPLAMMIDCAYEDNARNDKTAIVVGGYDWERSAYIWEATEGRYGPKELISKVAAMLDHYESIRRPIFKIGIESISYRYVADQFKERFWNQEHRDLAIVKLKHESVSKTDRIRVLIPFHEQHKLFVKKGLSNIIGQMLRFPSQRGGIDALDAAAYLPRHLYVPTHYVSTKRLPAESTTRAIEERLKQEKKRLREERLGRSARAFHMTRRPGYKGGRRIGDV